MHGIMGVKQHCFMPIFKVFFDVQIFGIDFFPIFCFPVANLLKVMKGKPYCHEKLSKRVVV
jgi:hypothetical protein